MEWREKPGGGQPSESAGEDEQAGYSVLDRSGLLEGVGRWLRRPVFLAALGLVLLFAGLAALRGGGGPAAGPSLAGVEERIDALGRRLDAIDGQRRSVVDTDLWQRKADALAQRLDRSEAALSKRIEALEKRLEARTVASAASSAKAPAAVSAHVVQKGDTLYSIARGAGISVERLRQLNGLGPQEAIHPGDRLVLP